MGQIGPFEVLELADSGAMAHVWRARHVETDTPVAIKIVPRREGASDGQVFRFRAEIRAIARIVHHGVISIVDEGVLDDPTILGDDLEVPPGSPYIVMEWAPGGHLGERAMDMEWPQLRTILLSLLEALAAAHARGIIHRDIKPQNILFSEGRVRLADFGVAFESESEQVDPARGKIVGSPNFMSPEQILCRWRDYGPWTDLYAVGCVAWLMTTGKAPFSRSSSREVLHAHLRERLPHYMPLFPVPLEFERWCSKLLAKNPNERFEFAADAAYQLLALGEPVGRENTKTVPYSLTELRPEKTFISPPVFVPLDQAPWSPSNFNPTALPVVPETWRRPLPAPRDIALSGTGLAVFSMATARFIGRESERDLVWSALTGAHRNEGCKVFFVEGPAGSGKTAFNRWFSERAQELGACTLLTARHQLGQDGLDALRHMLNRFFNTTGLDGEERYDRLRNVLERWKAETLAVELDAFLDDEQRSGRESDQIALVSPAERFMSLRRLLTVLTQKRPVVIMLDDIQWGTTALEWIRYALKNDDQLPIIWVATWRQQAPGTMPLTTALYEELTKESRVSTIGLDPLGDAEARALIQSRVRLDDETLAALVTRSQGNPLFAEQLVEHWIQSERLMRTEQGFRVRDRGVLSVPDSVHEIWQNRLTVLQFDRTDDRQFALEMAATLGQRFERDVWMQACRRAKIKPQRSFLATLEEHDLIYQEGPGSFEFVHSLLCESIQRRARDAGRARFMHLACANTLEDVDRVSWHRVGQHYFAAEHFLAAIPAFQKASEVRRDIGDPAGHLDMLYQMAISLRRARVPRSDRRWAFVRLRWSFAQRLMGHVKTATRHSRSAKRQLCPQTEPALYAEAALGEGIGTKFVIDHKSALPVLADAVRVSAMCDNFEVRMEAHRLYSMCLRERGDLEESAHQFRLMEAIATEGNFASLPPEKSKILRVNFALERFQQAWLAGRIDEAVAYSAHCEDLARLTGNRSRLGVVCFARGRVLLDAHRFPEAAETYRVAIEALSSVGLADRFSAMAYLVVCMVQMGQYDEALETHAEVMSGLHGCGRHLSARLGRPFILGALARLGRWDEWEASFEDMKSLIDSDSYGPLFAHTVEFSIDHIIDVDEYDRAERLLALLRQLYTKKGTPGDVERIDAISSDIQSNTVKLFDENADV